ncbi:MAG: translation initiation factor [Chlamydiota bacterium]
MPFTIGGDWIEKPSPVKPKKAIKVVLEKRKNSILTVILHLDMSAEEMGALASDLKKKLGCGGTVKDEKIEIQGDKVQEILKFLKLK